MADTTKSIHRIVKISSLLLVSSLLFLSCDESNRHNSCFWRESRASLASFGSMDPSHVSELKKVRARWEDFEGKRVQVLSFGEGSGLLLSPEIWSGAVLQGVVRFSGESQNLARPMQLQISVLEDGDEVIEVQTYGPDEINSFNLSLALPEASGNDSRLKISPEIIYPQGARPSDKRAKVELISPQLIRRESLCERPEGPNLILVTSDTTRADELKPYGGPAGELAIARLASEGAVFDRAYSVAFGTTPSHSSIMTSKHAIEHGVYNNKTVLADSHLTLAEHLRDHGYLTAAFLSARPLAQALGLSQGFDVYEDGFISDSNSGLGSYSRHEKRADLTVDQAIAWIQSVAPEKFFLWIHFFDAHQPYAPPDPSLTAKYIPNGRLDLSERHRSEVARLKREGPKYLKRAALESLTESELLIEKDLAVASYRGEISFLDKELDRLINWLSSENLLDSTAIVFTADHGENFLEQGLDNAFNHKGLYEPVVRVPLVIRYPPNFPPASLRTDLVASIDIAPTLLHIAGIEPPVEFSGEDLRDETNRRSLTIEGSGANLVGVRSADWSYWGKRSKVANREEEVSLSQQKLFDLNADPWQTYDVSRVNTQVTDSMREIALGALSSAEDNAIDADIYMSTEHLEALRALGYIE